MKGTMVKQMLLFCGVVLVNSIDAKICEEPSTIINTEMIAVSRGMLTEIVLWGKYFHNLNKLEIQYSKKHAKRGVYICCKNCAGHMTSGSFVGWITAATLKGIVDGENNFAEMEEYMSAFCELLKTSEPSEVEDFMVKVVNELSIKCPECDKTIWEEEKNETKII
jgi:hypothetical protein